MNLNSLPSDVQDQIHQKKKNILTSEVEIKGTLHFKGELIFDEKLKAKLFQREI